MVQRRGQAALSGATARAVSGEGLDAPAERVALLGVGMVGYEKLYYLCLELDGYRV